MIEKAIASIGDRDQFAGTYTEWLEALLAFIKKELNID